MEQLAQKRLHLLFRTCFASMWTLTRVLSDLWSTQHRGGLIILNYISNCQWRWEQPICHHGTDLQLRGRSESEVPGEKAKSKLGKWQGWSWSQEQHPSTNWRGRKHNPGLGCACGSAQACVLGVLQPIPAVAHSFSAWPHPQWGWQYIVICLSKGTLLFDHFQLRCE